MLLYNFPGGVIGFSDVLWKVTKHESDRISFSYYSFDGEEGDYR